MDPNLATLVDQDTPKFNPAIANGLACLHMREVEEYVDHVFTLAAKGFPPELEYCGYARCTPLEEFKERTRRRENKSTFDISESHLYMVRYFFKFRGEPLKDVYLYLPYVGPGGTITLSGSLFTISPVLADRVISVGTENIFVRLLRGKVTFKRLMHQIVIDELRDPVQVVYGLIYNKRKQAKIKPTVKAESTLAHYLFAKYGVRETFRRYGKTEIVIGERDINRNNYPSEDWVICHSTQAKPRTAGRFHYQATELRVAIKRSEFTPLVKALVGGFFYVVDHFPTRLPLDYIDDPRAWMIVLGHLLKSSNYNEGILYTEMQDHINSLDEYIDRPVAVKLKDIGIQVEDFYDLMDVVLQKYSEWILEASDKINSMYEKELSVMYFVMLEITEAIFRFYFKIKAASTKTLNVKGVESILKTHLRMGLIFSITREHGEVSASSYSGDNKVLKFTSILVPQSDSSKLKKRNSRAAMGDPTKRIHVSVAEVGGYSNIPKSAPDGHSRINVFVGTDEKNVVKRNPELVEFLDAIQVDLNKVSIEAESTETDF